MSGETFEKVLTWLTAELAQVAETAKEAADATDGGRWKVAEEASCECCYAVRTDDSTASLVLGADSRYVDHVARFDPESALRLVDAHKMLIVAYRQAVHDWETALGSDYTYSWLVEHNGRISALRDVITALAVGWGWVDEE